MAVPRRATASSSTADGAEEFYRTRMSTMTAMMRAMMAMARVSMSLPLSVCR